MKAVETVCQDFLAGEEATLSISVGYISLGVSWESEIVRCCHIVFAACSHVWGFFTGLQNFYPIHEYTCIFSSFCHCFCLILSVGCKSTGFWLFYWMSPVETQSSVSLCNSHLPNINSFFIFSCIVAKMFCIALPMFLKAGNLIIESGAWSFWKGSHLLSGLWVQCSCEYLWREPSSMWVQSLALSFVWGLCKEVFGISNQVEWLSCPGWLHLIIQKLALNLQFLDVHSSCLIF